MTQIKNHTAKIENILVVEDETNIRNLTCEFLSMMSFKVQSVENGQEALNLLDTHHFDLIITDVMMPVMNGKELVRNIRQRIDGMMPIIVVSGSYVEGLELINDDRTKTLRKPYGFSMLINEIDSFTLAN
jgi:DNA-binding response OmpR family regulator